MILLHIFPNSYLSLWSGLSGPENQVVRLGLHADDRAVGGSVASAETRAARGARCLGTGLGKPPYARVRGGLPSACGAM